MSGHEGERLSAYLDGELDARARQAVENHLAECGECSERLARLAAADAGLAKLRVHEPPGYFDGFAARVVSGIKAASPKAPRQRTVPSWAWAAAAAALLAVVTPLTLREWRSAEMQSSEELGVAEQAEATRTPAFEGRGVRTAGPESGASASEVTRPAKRDTISGQALARDTIEEEGPAVVEAPTGRDTAQDVIGSHRRDKDISLGAVAVPAPEAARRRGPLEEPAVPSAPADLEDRMAAASVRAEGGAARKASSEETAFQRLDAERPRTAEEWRSLREAWRTFARSHADGSLADEARVRAIEAGLEAYRRSADEADAARVRRDAALYLARADAFQRERVERAAREVAAP